MLLLLLSLSVVGLPYGGQGQTFQDTAAIHKMRQSIENYTANVRPLWNQSEIMEVWVYFELLNIVEVDDVSQSFAANGFFMLAWQDEILMWDPAEYGGETRIVPDKKDVWFPRLMLWNTLEGRDFFSEDPAPLVAEHHGETAWIPGGPFSISCSLDVSNYPFDEQLCVAGITSMDYTNQRLRFVAFRGEFGRDHYTDNEEWDLVNGIITTASDSSNLGLPTFKVIFHIKRKAAAFLLSVIIPVVFLSFLNLLVFVIPVDAGEKIGYGITVSLAQVLSMTFISEQLPRSSSPIPKVTIYLFTLLMMSFSIVVVSIIIVFLHHMEKKEEKQQRITEKVQTTVEKFSNIPQVVTTLENGKSGQDNMADHQQFGTKGDNNENVVFGKTKSFNKYKVIGKYIDMVSFVIFLFSWLGLTVGFGLSIILPQPNNFIPG